MKLTQDQQKVKDFLDSHPHLSKGVVNEEEMCTIAVVNMALTGRLTAGLHPCVSHIIHKWVIVTQDSMPDAIRDSGAWRESIPLIAGSAASEEIERARLKRIIAWMWDSLADKAVLAAVPEDARQAWGRMLVERTPAAAYAASNAVAYAIPAVRAAVDAAADAAEEAAGAAEEADDAAYAVRYAAEINDSARTSYWQRRDPAGLLAGLVSMR